LIPGAGAKTMPCPFHQVVHLDKTGQWQVKSTCESPENMQHVSWFVLPPVQEWYFRNKNPFYKVLPPFRPDCSGNTDRRNMDVIYPKNNSRIYIPVDLDGKPGSAVFKVAHRNAGILVYWHLDDQFIGTTAQVHQMALSPSQGMHRLTLVDQNGESMRIGFEVISK
jgi:penicillin-binding protein 1C